jgi:cytochrome c553
MKFASVLALLSAVWGCAHAFGAEPPPLWAWGETAPADSNTLAAEPAGQPPEPQLDNTKLYDIPGSKFRFTAAQINDPYAPADWFPEDHPEMPDIVAKGRASASPPIWACAFCHLPNGKGRPENANLTGQSYEYLVQQMYNFKNRLRTSSDPRKTNTQLMAGFAEAMSHEDIVSAARYFASIPATPRVKVVESDTAPKTVARGGVFLALEGADAGTEPLGNRIVETPISNKDFEVTRNPRSGFIAYVPKGSIARGENLVRYGGGKVAPCTECHGQDLRGIGATPALAGRSPSYLVRQMYDMQHRKRDGLMSMQMATLLINLNNNDLLFAAAYLASLEP